MKFYPVLPLLAVASLTSCVSNPHTDQGSALFFSPSAHRQHVMAPMEEGLRRDRATELAAEREYTIAKADYKQASAWRKKNQADVRSLERDVLALKSTHKAQIEADASLSGEIKSAESKLFQLRKGDSKASELETTKRRLGSQINEMRRKLAN